VLAEAGKEVLVIERGGTCGAKNMTGGRLYGGSLEKTIPGFAVEGCIYDGSKEKLPEVQR